MTSPLSEFLKASNHSVSREAILRHRFLFDVGIAGAAAGYAMTVNIAEVDRDGHDVVVEDSCGVARRVQLKSVSGNRDRFPVARRLLCPAPHTDGCVVLQAVRSIDDDNVAVDYEYTDRFVIQAFRRGILARRGWRGALPEWVTALDADIERGDPVVLRRAVFVPVSGPAALLALMGLTSRVAVPAPLSECLRVAPGSSGSDGARSLLRVVCNDPDLVAASSLPWPETSG